MVPFEKCTSDLGRGTAMELVTLDLTCIAPLSNTFGPLLIQHISFNGAMRVLAGEVSVG